jgi:hypothetical protein
MAISALKSTNDDPNAKAAILVIFGISLVVIAPLELPSGQ